MNDRFKFRHWDKQVNKMRYGDIQLGSNGIPFIISPELPMLVQDIEDVVTMQCTGLKDKNGKLIYEGDVVKEEGFYWEVVWNTNVTYQWSLRRIEPNSIYPHIITFSSLLSWKKYEVIGNIYENEDLLNG